MADKQVYTFTNDIDEVEIGSRGAKIAVESTDGEAITAEYDTPYDRPELCAVLCGKRLTFKETFDFRSIFCKPTEGYMITVRLPRKLYKTLRINTASGGVEINDSAVTAELFDLNTASGNVEVNTFFESVKIKTASGSISLCGSPEKTAKSVDINAASGSITVGGYKAEKFSISSVSGKTTYTGASGEGRINVTSGKISVTYAEWNADLKISAVSGSVNIALPGDSGAKIRFDGVSGTVKTDLGQTDGTFISLGKGTDGELGGANRHNIGVNLVSGTVTITKGSGVADEEKIVDMTADLVTEKAE